MTIFQTASGSSVGLHTDSSDIWLIVCGVTFQQIVPPPECTRILFPPFSNNRLVPAIEVSHVWFRFPAERHLHATCLSQFEGYSMKDYEMLFQANQGPTRQVHAGTLLHMKDNSILAAWFGKTRIQTVEKTVVASLTEIKADALTNASQTRFTLQCFASDRLNPYHLNKTTPIGSQVNRNLHYGYATECKKYLE